MRGTGMRNIKLGTAGTALIAALVMVGLLVGVTASASAGDGPAATVAKCGKKKKGKKGAAAAGKKKKKGCKKPKKPVTPTSPPAALTLTPNSFTFPNTQHGSAPCNSCPTKAFTITNTGGTASGVPTSSITEVHAPVTGIHDPGYFIDSSTCTTALPPAGTCTVTVRFIPNSNAGDKTWTSTLNVAASPGTAGSASLSGVGD